MTPYPIQGLDRCWLAKRKAKMVELTDTMIRKYIQEVVVDIDVQDHSLEATLAGCFDLDVRVHLSRPLAIEKLQRFANQMREALPDFEAELMDHGLGVYRYPKHNSLAFSLKIYKVD